MAKIKDYLEIFEKNGILTGSRAPADAEVKYISYNSREVVNGTLFVCKGAHFREEYLADAYKKGAVACVSEVDRGEGSITVSDIRLAMSLMADFFYESAYKKLNLVGITGTKGKSTTAYFVKYIFDEYLTAEGKKNSAIVSSIDTYDGVVNEESHLTTPEPFELFSHFSNAVKSGIDYFTMEVSSQALKYGRVRGVEFTVGCYLNIGLDHISPVEHPDFEDYFQSKMKIFSQCKTAVVNLDSERSEEVLQYAKNAPELVTFSTRDSNADIYGYNIRKDGSDTVFTVRTKSFEGDFTLTIPGLFNVENALCAIGVALCFGIDEKYIRNGLLKARSSGRMEVYENANRRVTAIVDYAHNRMSFESLFTSVRKEYPERKVAIVFGCPGKKALIRRKDLGEVSGQYADMVYLTEEDSGEEPVEQISAEIAKYVESVGGKYKIINDRGEAIRQAVLEGGDNSVILITGKGNETRQKRGLEYIDCPTDVEYALKALKEYDVAHGIDSEEKIKSVQDVLPLLHRLYGRKVVIKLGGSCLNDEGLMSNLLEDISLLSMVGAKVTVVHGGGKEISSALSEAGLTPEFYEGYRVTGEREMLIAERVLSGGINKRLTALLGARGIKSAGISGVDGGTLKARHKQINGKALGRVGEVESVDTALTEALLEKGYTVVMSPVGVSLEDSRSLNINADDAASAIAKGLLADYLIFITDVNGIFLDSQNEKTALERLDLKKAKMLIREGLVKGGMIPKLQNIISLLESGVGEVCVLNGKVRYNLISEFIGSKIYGTVVTG